MDIVVMLGMKKNSGIGKRESGREMTSGVGIGSREFTIKKFFGAFGAKNTLFLTAGENYENFGRSRSLTSFLLAPQAKILRICKVVNEKIQFFDLNDFPPSHFPNFVARVGGSSLLDTPLMLSSVSAVF